MGINVNDAFPSKWMKADDIAGDTHVTIKSVTMERIGDDETKPVVWFQEFQKGMVLNKTNANNCSSIYGPDTDSWIGRPMVLTTAWVDFQGRSTLALRLYPPRGGNTFVSGTPQASGHSHQAPLDHGRSGDPRGDVPPPASEYDYGGVRG